MSAKVILNEVERLLQKHSDKKTRKTESKDFTHIVEITGIESAGAFVSGTKKWIDKLPNQGDNITAILKANNTQFQFRNVISQIFTDIISGALKLKGTKRVQEKTAIKFSDFFVSGAGNTSKQFAIMPDSNPNRLIFQVDEKNTSNTFTIYRICKEMRKEIFHRWLDNIDIALTDDEMKDAMKEVVSTTDYSHKGRTVGRAGFENFVRDIKDFDSNPDGEFDITITSMDMLQYIVDRANIEWNVDLNPELAQGRLSGETRKLTVRGMMESQGSKRADDWMARKDKGGGVKRLIEEGAIEFLRENTPSLLSTKGRESGGLAESVKATGSPSIDENVVSDVVEEITKKAKPKKRVKNKTVTIKKQPKVARRKRRKIQSGRKGSGKKAITTKIRLKVAATGATLKRKKEKGKGELNLGKVKTNINRKLGAEIRRNMGRPALINQTGRFSDSAELVSLRQAQNSIIGTYSYQLRPYETFENNGDRQWPAGYNPKPLIAKSIRNLAVGAINDKFILRRG